MKPHAHKPARSLPCLCATLLMTAAMPCAAGDFEDPGDHPLIPRISDSEMITHQTRELAQIELPVGRHAGRDGFEETLSLEGRHTSYTYVLKDAGATTLMVKRAYVPALEQNGFEVLWSGSGSEELGRRFRVQDIFNRPRAGGLTSRARGDNLEMRYFAAKHADEGVHVGILMYQNRDHQPVMVVEVLEEHQAELEIEHVAADPEAAHEEDLRRLRENPEALTTADLESRLMRDGRVAVRDILFGFDSDEIVPASADALATIGELMRETGNLNLLVVGHTDAVGDFEYNLNLSMQRARAVTDWLQNEYDIPESRLQAAGAGMMAPASTNRTDEGRAQNRRVELVEITR